MNRMIASTISPGATTAAARLICLAVQDPPTSGDQHEHERPQKLGEQPAVLELGIVELGPRSELEHQQTLSPRQVVTRQIWVSLNRHQNQM